MPLFFNEGRSHTNLTRMSLHRTWVSCNLVRASPFPPCFLVLFNPSPIRSSSCHPPTDRVRPLTNLLRPELRSFVSGIMPSRSLSQSKRYSSMRLAMRRVASAIIGMHLLPRKRTFMPCTHYVARHSGPVARAQWACPTVHGFLCNLVRCKHRFARCSFWFSAGTDGARKTF